MTNQKLIARCRKGKISAQKELYETYSSTMYYICLRYAKNPDVAQDLLHDGFMIIFEKIKDYKGEGSFEGWMKRIMVNHSLGYLRQLAKDRAVFADVDYDANTGGEKREEEGQVISMDKVLRILDRLPTGCRTVFNLYHMEGYSHKEIASELNVSEGTSKSQLNRAKDLLKKELKKEGGSYVG